MILHKAQKTIAKDTHRFRVVNCGRRFGKTTLAVLEMVAKGLSKDDTRIAYIAPTYQQARDIAWQELKKITVPIQVEVNESRLEVKIKTQDGGVSTIWLRGWESIETLRGQKFDFIVIDEVASMRKFFVNWEEVVRPTLTDTRGEGLFISTPKGFNHFYDLYQKEQEDGDYKSFTFTTYDNPYIPVEEIDKAKQELPEYRFAQEYLADFKKTEGLVYNLGNHHIIDKHDWKVDAVIGGVDWGWSHPAALTVLQYADGRFFIVDEWYETNKTTPQIIEAMKNLQMKWKVNKWYADSANPEKIEEASRGTGLYVIPYEKKKDSIVNGISYINQLLLENKLQVYRDCVSTLEEFNLYRYPEDKLNLRELPEPENDHLMDAIRYALNGYKPATRFIEPRVSKLQTLLSREVTRNNANTDYD